ncbi:ATP-binding cassette domain-containing protein [Terrimonas sp. NA20]|uniref:ATP-binding cassette domain-containing protein n=1 Tax=Terrimonas ginsenosidimutans TaxID=2908004 RepID=A0ABS9L082_9BACT|nr:ATP-binding cassette domain-containing protein [Terrimonas ginsenosidimutans]MCG2617996.1 ATP-binding cassette domain-containing protein [Terrimonas ginsenosidimutans]
MKNETLILEVNDLSVLKSSVPVVKNVSFGLRAGENLAITGAAGSGKTTLALALAGRIFFSGKIRYAEDKLERIVWVEQQHHFKNRSNVSNFYYQQRFNSMDAEDAATVDEYLGNEDVSSNPLLKPFRIDELLEKPLIQLSNGENKKVQIVRALLASPKVLILDQPFVGLDVDTRAFLHERINELAATGITIILVTQPDEVPACITTVVTLKKDEPAIVQDRKTFADSLMPSKDKHKQPVINEALLSQLIVGAAVKSFSDIIRMEKVHVRYGDKVILDNINWVVKPGECWLLSGANGAGKSTLLSLITADNPQAYANEIYLFDRKRGSGETIWDIKKNIGFLSPELMLFFENSSNVFDAVASGLFDTIGLFRQVSDQQMLQVYGWLELLGVKSIARKRLNELSQGEQRKVLLARALIKNPPLLILDEPCQGLDDETEAELNSLIDIICRKSGKTLVYVTHYANRRPACITQYIRLDKGRVVL